MQPVLNRANGNASQRHLANAGLANAGAYVNAGAQYMRQVSGILKDKVNSLRSNSLEGPQGIALFSFCFYCDVSLATLFILKALRVSTFSHCLYQYEI
jgi:hypothetical protein